MAQAALCQMQIERGTRGIPTTPVADGQAPGLHTILLVVAIAVNIAGNLVLIPRLGVVGAALSMETTVVISSLLLAALSRWRLGVRL